MTAPTFSSFNDYSKAWNAIYDFRVSDEGFAMVVEHRDALDDFIKYDAPLLTLSQTAEYVFANRAKLTVSNPNLVALAARVAEIAFKLSIDNMAGDRGQGITDALRRDSGEETSARYPWPDPAADPEVRNEFALPAQKG